MRVLIADDSAIVRERLVTMLSDLEGIEIVAQAADAEETVRIVNALEPDAVILDIHMPKGNGLLVLEEIKRKYPSMTVIMLTNYPYREYRKICDELGADLFFDKSADFDLLPDTLLRLAHSSATPLKAVKP
ncbi:MAG: response regulator transcription factor [Deltaproteobacteria bacterium]|nr:response regulator transcription factor [Deltaproteobacteria bacterium]